MEHGIQLYIIKYQQIQIFLKKENIFGFYSSLLIQNIIMTRSIQQIYGRSTIFWEIMFWRTSGNFTSIQINNSDTNFQCGSKGYGMHMIGFAIHRFNFLKMFGIQINSLEVLKPLSILQYLLAGKILSCSCLLPKNSGRSLPLFVTVQMSQGEDKQPNNHWSAETSRSVSN